MKPVPHSCRKVERRHFGEIVRIGREELGLSKHLKTVCPGGHEIGDQICVMIFVHLNGKVGEDTQLAQSEGKIQDWKRKEEDISINYSLLLQRLMKR